MCGSDMYKVKFGTPSPQEDPVCPVETLIWRSDDGREVSIRSDRGGLTADEFVDELVRPLMLGCTYHPSSVDEALGQNEFGDREDGNRND